MPRSRRALGKRPRSPKSRSVLGEIRSLILDIEEPLNDAADFVRALGLIGHGVMPDDDGKGRAIAATAWAALRGLDQLRAVWTKLHRVARSAR